MLQRALLDAYSLGFMRRALVELVLLGLLGAVVGAHVLLRRMAFLTEALQHTVFPGIAIAFAAGQSLLLGALVAAILTVVLLGRLTGSLRVDPDAALALLIAAFFGLGVVVVSHRSGYAADLNQLLFGRILDVDDRQLVETAVIVAMVLATLAALHKELVLVALDRSHAEALGYRVAVLDLVLNVAVALTVVVAVRAVGTVLVVAFVVTPAATARLVTHSVGASMAVAAGLAAVLGWLGLSTSYEASVSHGIRLAAGATVVVAFSLAFCVAGAVALLGRRSTKATATAVAAAA